MTDHPSAKREERPPLARRYDLKRPVAGDLLIVA